MANESEVYALGRVINSEFSYGNDTEQASVGWVTVNAALAAGKALIRYIQGSAGTFGKQGSQRPVSSASEPTAKTLTLAKNILDHVTPDITYGATKFFSPDSQLSLHEAYLAGETSTEYKHPQTVIYNWGKEGLSPYVPENVRGNKLTLFTKTPPSVLRRYFDKILWLALGIGVVYWVSK